MPSKKPPTLEKTRAKKVAARAEEHILSEFSRKKRQQIIEAALETFLELGYEGSRMEPGRRTGWCN